MRLLGAWALLSALAGCGEPRPRTTEPLSPSTSYRGTWQLVEGHGPKGDVPVVDDFRITLNLRDKSASGTAACNWYSGDVVMRSGSFDMRGGGVTEMACRPDVMKSESAYLAALSAADVISREGDTLIIKGNAAELRFELLPPIPTAELINTRWALDTLIHGPSNDSVSSSARSGYLVLKSDGTVAGSTGCRELYGEWRENGDEIAFTTFGADGKCPVELRDQDGHVVGVLGDGFRVQIDGDQLQVLSRGGLGLAYRAAT